MTISNPTEHRETGTGQLLVHVSRYVAVLTFNNPAKRNALSREIREALPGALAALQADKNVRVVVVTGAGDKAFTSGADMSEYGDQWSSPTGRAEYDRSAAAIDQAWDALEKPIIAMIRGFCIGGGLLTALQADIRIASEDSQFSYPAGRLGNGARFAVVAALRDLMGPARTAEFLFSARRFSAAEAAQMGLVNHVVPAAGLHEQVMTLASAIADNAPLTVAASKVAIRETSHASEPRDMVRVESMIEECYRSQDCLEGKQAFAEKRPPVFTGH
jgi:enoyl-CoA hydratase